jgi:hypothetical protein
MSPSSRNEGDIGGFLAVSLASAGATRSPLRDNLMERAMSTQKTLPTGASVDAFIEGIADERKRADSVRLVELMQAATGEPPVLWGGSMIGFGSYHYRYASGHEGDAPLVAFAPRARAFSLYLTCDLERRGDVLARLGRHRHGKGCLYITRLSDVDEDVLRDLIDASVTEARERDV